MKENSIVLVALQFIIIFWLLIINPSIFTTTYPLTISLFGFVLGLSTFYYNHLGNFNIQPEIKKDAKLITQGPYKLVRHPMYSSVMLIMLGVICTKFSVINIALYILLVLILFLKASKEEKLWQKKDTTYTNYKSSTKMFVPYLF